MDRVTPVAERDGGSSPTPGGYPRLEPVRGYLAVGRLAGPSRTGCHFTHSSGSNEVKIIVDTVSVRDERHSRLIHVLLYQEHRCRAFHRVQHASARKSQIAQRLPCVTGMSLYVSVTVSCLRPPSETPVRQTFGCAIVTNPDVRAGARGHRSPKKAPLPTRRYPTLMRGLASRIPSPRLAYFVPEYHRQRFTPHSATLTSTDPWRLLRKRGLTRFWHRVNGS
ncbi:hypothetical protein CCUS01_06808 [Colletotrichum cuscutae]|uniref:Uncharacterized protein n=1 Tax=Colletotrichum cuscutae TaxID=1209917 RepID=A0AAI9V544_9PEZI|nr:hypothetical protein CCUS01_06808 [Colletotrichum cuscutae]